MCLLIVSKKDFPEDELLNLGWEQNSHGAGIAYLDKENKKPVVRWKKGLTLEEIKAFRGKVKGPHIIHFRLVSVGGKCPELCHPFAINAKADHSLEGTAEMVLAHNGTWNNYSRELLLTLDNTTQLPAGPWSDTRAMAWLANMKGMKFLSSISEKIAVLKNTGEVEVFNQYQFTDHKGLLLSYDPFARATRNNKTVSTTAKNNNISGNFGNYSDWTDSPGTNIAAGYKTSGAVKHLTASYQGLKPFKGHPLTVSFD